MSLTRLSANTLNIFCDCPRCFWLHMNKKFQRPKGIFPSLPGGMDRLYKGLCDRDRDNPEAGIMRSILDQIGTDVTLWGTKADMKKWRAWNVAPMAEFPEYGVKQSGGLDEIVTVGNNQVPCLVAPFDWKTSSRPPRNIDTKKYKASPSNPMIPEYAGRQQDLYGLQLSKNGFKLDGRGFVVWTWPVDAKESGGSTIGVPFEVKILHHEIDLAAARDLLKQAGKCLAGSLPEPGEKCEYCSYACGYVGEVHEVVK